jgi:hypothetical protein
MSMAERPEGLTAGPVRRWRLGRMWYYGVAGLLGLGVIGGAYPPGGGVPPPATPATPRPTGAAATPAGAASPLDEPLRLLDLARQAYQGVQDYTCLLVKRERMNGQLPPDSLMTMQVRTRPFSVYLRWHEPRSLAGQEVCYVAGRNGDRMRVRPNGLLGVTGFISLDPDDPRAKQTSRHSIREAGIGNLLERFGRDWGEERVLNVTQVRTAEYEYNKRRCTRVELTRPTNPGGRILYYRTVVYFDKENHLPIRLECYDWPRGPNDPGQVVEVYSYVNLRLNVGLTDAVFDH